MGDTAADDLNKLRLENLQELNNEAEGFCFSIENSVNDEIRNGNLDELNETLEKIDIDYFIDHTLETEKSEEDALRSLKNTFISNNTISRIAAKNGQVPPLILYLISERYNILIENADSMNYLKENVFRQMAREYCTVVSNFSTKNYSSVMKDIVYEITQNLTSNLTLKDIADRHDMHPVHLARKFKSETGITFIAYINELRISLAKYYFHLNEYRLNEVVHLAGFNSHSYFTKVFKKLTGLTPTKYIRQLPHHD